MQVAFTIGELSRGKEYRGEIRCNLKVVSWKLTSTIPFSGLDEELAHRKSLGQDVRTARVQDELFQLALERNGKKLKLPDAHYRFLLMFLTGEASNYHDAPISTIWEQLTNGQGGSPFEVVMSMECQEDFAKVLFGKKRK